MSLRNEQCNKVCRILDDVLANRPTERDSLITAVRKAFGALETEPQWIPCSERLPQIGTQVLCCNRKGSVFTSAITYISNGIARFGQHYGVTAWMPLPESYKGDKDGE